MKFKQLLLVTVLFLTVTNVLGLYFLRINDSFSRLRPISEFTEEKLLSQNSIPKHHEFYTYLTENGFSRDNQTFEQIVSIQQFIGNSVINVGVYDGSDRSIDLLKKGLQGTPLACGSLAQIMNDALISLGYRSRIVQLYRSSFSNFDTHVLIEVLLNNEWVIFDPTFNITYEREGVLLGVGDVQKYLSHEGPLSIKQTFYGPRAYPAQIENYYMDWRPLFSNAYTLALGDRTLGKVPPFRWWIGPTRYYFGKNPILWASAINNLYYIFSAVLPVLISITLFLFTILQLRSWITSIFNKSR